MLRENLINRIYDQRTGYWQASREGMDYLSQADHGTLLVDYFGLSESEIVSAVERLIADGNYELAATALASTHDNRRRSCVRSTPAPSDHVMGR